MDTVHKKDAPSGAPFALRFVLSVATVMVAVMVLLFLNALLVGRFP